MSSLTSLSVAVVSLKLKTRRSRSRHTSLGQEGAELLRETERCFIDTAWLTFTSTSDSGVQLPSSGAASSPAAETPATRSRIHRPASVHHPSTSQQQLDDIPGLQRMNPYDLWKELYVGPSVCASSLLQPTVRVHSLAAASSSSKWFKLGNVMFVFNPKAGSFPEPNEVVLVAELNQTETISQR